MRLSRVLSRFVEFRGIEDSDYRHFWAAYRKGALKDIEELPDDLGPQEFIDAFLDQIERLGLSHGWTFLAPSKSGYMPVGFAWAWSRGRVIEIADIIWFPWASSRNILESTANFMNSMRKMAPNPMKPEQKFLIWEQARMKDKKFFETMCRLGIMRRVGHVHGLYSEGPAVMFETREA